MGKCFNYNMLNDLEFASIKMKEYWSKKVSEEEFSRASKLFFAIQDYILRNLK